MTAIIAARQPRGIRNNNPGNIRRNAIHWEGMKAKQTDDSYIQFTDPRYGFRAMVRILRNYQRRGLDTLRKIITTWAPPHENNTQAYVTAVADHLHIRPDELLDLDRHLLALLKAIHRHENGILWADYYSDELIQEGIAWA